MSVTITFVFATTNFIKGGRNGDKSDEKGCEEGKGGKKDSHKKGKSGKKDGRKESEKSGKEDRQDSKGRKEEDFINNVFQGAEGTTLYAVPVLECSNDTGHVSFA